MLLHLYYNMRSCLPFVIFKHLRLYGFYLLSVSPNLNPTICVRVHRDLNLAALQEQSLGLVLLPQAADVHLFSHSLGRDTLRPYSRSHAGCHEGAQDKMLWSYPTASLCQDDLSQILAAPHGGALSAASLLELYDCCEFCQKVNT